MPQPYYYDESGFVYSKPFHQLQIPVSVSNPDEAQQLVDRQFKEVKNNLTLTARLNARASKSYNLIRAKINSARISSSSVMTLGEEYYTCWFVVAYKSGTRAGSGRFLAHLGQSRSPESIKYKGSYYKLTPSQLAYWEPKISNSIAHPLTLQEVKELASVPDETVHPLYTGLLSLSLQERILAVNEGLNAFWDNYPGKSQTPDNKLLEYAKSFILKLAIYHRIMDVSRSEAILSIAEKMDESGTTVFPLDETGCMVAYINGTKLEYRSLPMPLEKMHYFQRYGPLGQSPMTKKEFAQKYKELVNPNSKLFG